MSMNGSLPMIPYYTIHTYTYPHTGTIKIDIVMRV